MQYLRLADQDDMDLLYEWANDDLVRNNSFNTSKIPYADHVEWFQRMMASCNVEQYIFMDDNNPVGQVRITLYEDTAEIGYSIAADSRGHGYGKQMISELYKNVSENHPEIKKLIAKVKEDNKASKKIFEDEGYKMKYICYETDVRGGAKR